MVAGLYSISLRISYPLPSLIGFETWFGIVKFSRCLSYSEFPATIHGKTPSTELLSADTNFILSENSPGDSCKCSDSLFACSLTASKL